MMLFLGLPNTFGEYDETPEDMVKELVVSRTVTIYNVK